MKPHEFQPDPHAGVVSDSAFTNCVCGKNRYHQEHFEGDRMAAASAYRRRNDPPCVTCGGPAILGQALCSNCQSEAGLSQVRAEHEVALRELQEEFKRRVVQVEAETDAVLRWREGLRTGVRVQVVKGHPSGPSFSGRLGTVAEPVFSQQLPQHGTVIVELDATVDAARWRGALLADHLMPPKATPPPTFASQEEADAWLEAETRRLHPELLPKPLRTQEEVERWLAEQEAQAAEAEYRRQVHGEWVDDEAVHRNESKLARIELMKEQRYGMAVAQPADFTNVTAITN